MNNEKYVKNLTEKSCREELIYLRNRLDDLDCEDTFGTEGWRHTFGMNNR